MLGETVQEIAIKDLNWEKANSMIKELVEEKYAVQVSLEEDLIIIDYVYAADCGCNQADRNKTVFMSRDEYEDNLDSLVEEIKKDWEEEHGK